MLFAKMASVSLSESVIVGLHASPPHNTYLVCVLPVIMYKFTLIEMVSDISNVNVNFNISLHQCPFILSHCIKSTRMLYSTCLHSLELLQVFYFLLCIFYYFCYSCHMFAILSVAISEFCNNLLMLSTYCCLQCQRQFQCPADPVLYRLLHIFR